MPPRVVTGGTRIAELFGKSAGSGKQKTVAVGFRGVAQERLPFFATVKPPGMRVLHTTLTLPALAVLATAISAPIAAQGSFLSFGRGSAYAVSDDGSVVVGTDFNGAFRWTSTGGSQPLGSAVRALFGMSADGNTVSANLPSAMTPSGLKEAALWTSAGQTWTALGGLSGSCSGTKTSNYGMSADGSTVVGLGWVGCAGRAFKWTQASGMVDLGVVDPNSRASRANGCSGDGRVVVGWDSHPTQGVRVAAAWFGTNGMLLVPLSPRNTTGAGEAWAANSDGTIIVGGGAPTPFRWTAVGGFEDLDPNNTSNGTAYGLNEDGQRIVGATGSILSGGFGAFMWTEEDGMLSLANFLGDQNITLPAGAALTWAFDISKNGKYVVGRRGDFRALNDEAFLITLPDGVRYGLREGGANVLDLDSAGSSALGQSLAVTTSGIDPVATECLLVLSAGSAKVPFAGGTILVDLTSSPAVLPLPVTAGTSTVNIPIPNLPALVGFAVYMQSFAVDTQQGGGAAMSNGVKMYVRA